MLVILVYSVIVYPVVYSVTSCMFVDMTGKCVGGGLLRNIAGSWGGRRCLEYTHSLYPGLMHVARLQIFSTYKFFAWPGLGCCLRTLSASAPAAACTRARLAAQLVLEQLLGLDSHHFQSLVLQMHMTYCVGT